jgi:hypothetical protein
MQHDADQKHRQDQHSDQPDPARFQRKPSQRQQPEQQYPGNLRLGGLIHGKQPENCGAQGRIRTSVARKERQIYSLLPLTTRPPVPSMARPAFLTSGGRQPGLQSCSKQDFSGLCETGGGLRLSAGPSCRHARDTPTPLYSSVRFGHGARHLLPFSQSVSAIPCEGMLYHSGMRPVIRASFV